MMSIDRAREIYTDRLIDESFGEEVKPERLPEAWLREWLAGASIEELRAALDDQTIQHMRFSAMRASLADDNLDSIGAAQADAYGFTAVRQSWEAAADSEVNGNE